jgi:hypothetical protein
MACQPPGAPASGNSASSSNEYCIADIGPDAAGAKIKEVFGMLSPSPLTLASVTPEGALYKVTFEFLQGKEKVSQSVHITKDGHSLLEAVSDLDARLNNLKKNRDFVSCLKEKGVKIFVSSKDRKTLGQLQIFGQFGGLITIDCAASEDNCKANGVTKVPSIGYQGKLTVGAQERAWFETLTLCK